jgi:hypothetical protein
MNTLSKNEVLAGISTFVLAALVLGLIITPSARMRAGSDDEDDRKMKINPPPFDFNDDFYKKNGIDLNALNSPAEARFGFFRQTGPPAPPGLMNWVIDPSNTSPPHNNVRILATTGAYHDSDGKPNQFFLIIAFARDRSIFAQDTGGVGGVPNARGIPLEAIVGIPNGNDPNLNLNALPPPLNTFVPNFIGLTSGNPSAFEAYAALKQVVNGTIAPSPCGTLGDGEQPCFPVAAAAAGEPDDAHFFANHLRQDWRITSNRSRIDNSAAFSYFGDNLLGMWVITYFWYTKFAVGGRGVSPTPTCQNILAAAGRQNGLNLDGTPIVHSGEELHFLEGVATCPSGNAPCQFGLPGSAMPIPLGQPGAAPCAQEGNLDPAGADGGAVWLVCPTIPDPTRGGIAKDAFLDTVHRANGLSLDVRITANFHCLQETGQFCGGFDSGDNNDNHGNNQK